MKPVELVFLARRGLMGVTDGVGVAPTDMVITAVRASSGVSRPRVQIGRRVLRPAGTMKTGWQLRLRQGETLRLAFQGDGRVGVWGFHLPSGAWR